MFHSGASSRTELRIAASRTPGTSRGRAQRHAGPSPEDGGGSNRLPPMRLATIGSLNLPMTIAGESSSSRLPVRSALRPGAVDTEPEAAQADLVALAFARTSQMLSGGGAPAGSVVRGCSRQPLPFRVDRDARASGPEYLAHPERGVRRPRPRQRHVGICGEPEPDGRRGAAGDRRGR